ncbi:MAG: YgjV family protein [Clostridia bacterium]|nr:YgjV family protein [Clostridia bacterium]
MEYILSQIFVIITYILLGATYFVKNRRLLLVLSMFAILTNATSYFFLSAWSGLLVTILALIRNIVFLVQNKTENDKIDWLDWLILGVFLTLLIAISITTFEGFLSLFSVFGSLTYTIAVWQRNEKVYKLLGIASSICTVIYYAFIGSLFGFLLESAMLVTIVVGTILFFRKEKQKSLNSSKI